MNGHSGAELCFLKHTVIKSGDARLAKSCSKQRSFDSNFVKTPRVMYQIGGESNRFSFSMERIHNTTTIFEASRVCLDKVFDYVEDNLKQSRMALVPSYLFIKKIRSIKGVNAFPEAESLIDRFESYPTIILPCGPMHGDLTFCNILCRDDDVWLIDFLDGIVSSPVMDVAKMRQDSFHGWIALFGAVNTKYVDDRILESFGDLPWLREMTLLSLLRIIPYASTPEVFNFLKREITRAFSNLE